MIFIHRSWVSTRWQWLVNLYKYRKETAVYTSRYNIQNSTETQNTENRKEKHTKQEKSHKKNIEKHKSSN